MAEQKERIDTPTQLISHSYPKRYGAMPIRYLALGTETTCLIKNREHEDEIREKQKRYREAHKEKKQKKRYEACKERVKKKNKIYYREDGLREEKIMIVGFGYHDSVPNDIYRGEITFEKEPTNPHDSNAVKVLVRGIHIAYVNKHHNKNFPDIISSSVDYTNMFVTGVVVVFKDNGYMKEKISTRWTQYISENVKYAQGRGKEKMKDLGRAWRAGGKIDGQYHLPNESSWNKQQNEIMKIVNSEYDNDTANIINSYLFSHVPILIERKEGFNYHSLRGKSKSIAFEIPTH
jgi:hypothetical protein